MTAEQNKQIVKRYLEEAWGTQDLAAMEAVVAEDVVFHDQVRMGLPPGRDSLRTVMEGMFAASADMILRIHQLIAEDDTVAVRYSVTGTHTGEFNGIPPTGRTFVFDGIAMVRLRDGRIVEGWQEADELGIARQLGVMPKGQMPRPVARAVVAAIRLRDNLARRRRTAPSA